MDWSELERERRADRSRFVLVQYIPSLCARIYCMLTSLLVLQTPDRLKWQMTHVEHPQSPPVSDHSIKHPNRYRLSRPSNSAEQPRVQGHLAPFHQQPSQSPSRRDSGTYQHRSSACCSCYHSEPNAALLQRTDPKLRIVATDLYRQRRMRESESPNRPQVRSCFDLETQRSRTIPIYPVSAGSNGKSK